MLEYLNAKFATALAHTNRPAKQLEKPSSKVRQEDKLKERIAFAFQ